MRLSLSPARPARSRRTLLSLQSLEGREVPAGNIAATLSPLGVLSITGDDDANELTLRVNAFDVVLTPGGTTAVNGSTAAVTLPGVVKSIKADFKGGADTVDIDGAAAFTITGATSLTLGDGDNTLNLVTTGQILLGALTVKGGDGSDTVTIQGGANSLVQKAASFNYSNGGSNTTLTDIGFGVGVTLKAGDAVGVPNAVTGTNVTVARTFAADLANSNPALVSFTGGSLGGLRETGFVVGALLQDTTVNGSINIKAGYQGDLQVDGATVTGSVAVIGGLASVEAFGNATTINGNLSLTGTGWTSASFETDTLSEVKGSVTVRGGWYNDVFLTNALFKVGKNMTFTMKGGDNSVTMGDGTAAVAVGGNFKYTGGAGVDSVSLDRVTLTGLLPLTGSVSILTLQGADVLSIENGSTFARTFTADMGTGDDTISVAQNPGSTGAVTFTGNARILGGIGNDTLLLGLDAGAGGDANSRVVFLGLKNLVDGGAGIDVFDDTTDQMTGATPIGWAP